MRTEPPKVVNLKLKKYFPKNRTTEGGESKVYQTTEGGESKTSKACLGTEPPKVVSLKFAEPPKVVSLKLVKLIWEPNHRRW